MMRVSRRWSSDSWQEFIAAPSAFCLVSLVSIVAAAALVRSSAAPLMIGAGVAAGASLLIFLRPAIILGIWLAVLPLCGDFTPVSHVGGLNVSRAVVLLTAIALLGQIASGTPVPAPLLVLAALGLAAASVVSYAGRPLPGVGDRSALINTILAPMIAATAFGAIAISRRAASRLLVVLGSTAPVLGAVAIVQHSAHDGGVFTAGSVYRPAGPFEHALVLATFIALATIPLADRMFRERSRAVWLIGTGAALALVGLFYTYSRGPFLALVLALLFLRVRGVRVRGFRAEIIFGLLALVFAVRSALTNHVVLARLSSSQTFDTRVSLYQTAWGFFKTSWMFGLGVRGFGHAIGSSLPDALGGTAAWFAVDNYYLNALVEGGVLSAAALLAVIVIALRRIVQSDPNDPLHRAGAALVVIGLITSLDFNALSYPSIAAGFFFGIRLMYLPAPAETERTDRGRAPK